MDGMSNWVRTEWLDSLLFSVNVVFGWERLMEKVREGPGMSSVAG